jgi:hypothetical protein
MLEFFDSYGTQEQCEALVRRWRWPEGFICPRCGGSWHSEFRRQDRLYFQCSGCRYQCIYGPDAFCKPYAKAMGNDLHAYIRLA